MSRGRPPGGTAVRAVGYVLDANGAQITVGVDCDAVAVSGAGVILDAAARKHFQLLFMEAERQAEAWQAEHASQAP
jgi:hypothetical protein